MTRTRRTKPPRDFERRWRYSFLGRKKGTKPRNQRFGAGITRIDMERRGRGFEDFTVQVEQVPIGSVSNDRDVSLSDRPRTFANVTGKLIDRVRERAPRP